MFLYITYTDRHGVERARFIGSRQRLEEHLAEYGMRLTADNRVLHYQLRSRAAR